jgi:hypothetical protein
MSLYAMFRRYTGLSVTETGFWRILTDHPKVLGDSVKQTNTLKHIYIDASGEQVLEVPGLHLTKCRVLRADNPRDLHMITERLKTVHTSVRVGCV